MDDALVPSSSNMRNAGEVLILVVMDDALVRKIGEESGKVFKVLILVVMDDALVLSPKGLTGLIWTGLNPCCNG